MACAGCQQRREIGRSVVAALRSGDMTGARAHLAKMAGTLRPAAAPQMKFTPQKGPIDLPQGARGRLRLKPGSPGSNRQS